MLAIMQATSGLIYMTVVIARMFALYSAEGSHNCGESRDKS
jgi:hypothetical protein